MAPIPVDDLVVGMAPSSHAARAGDDPGQRAGMADFASPAAADPIDA
jgi:hypothetical protein